MRRLSGLVLVLASSVAGAQQLPSPRFTATLGATHLDFPALDASIGTTLAASARLTRQVGGVEGMLTAHLLVPTSVQSLDALCPPNADCASTSSPTSLGGFAVGIGQAPARGRTLLGAVHAGYLHANGLRGSTPRGTATVGGDLSWRLGSARLRPVIGIAGTWFARSIAGARGVITPSVGVAW